MDIIELKQLKIKNLQYINILLNRRIQSLTDKIGNKIKKIKKLKLDSNKFKIENNVMLIID